MKISEMNSMFYKVIACSKENNQGGKADFMIEFVSGLAWFESKVRPILADNFEIKYINEKNGDLGDLSGVQFNSNKMGGYIYFWGTGYVSYQLVNYEKELELVEDTTEEILSQPYDKIFQSLIDHISC